MAVKAAATVAIDTHDDRFVGCGFSCFCSVEAAFAVLESIATHVSILTLCMKHLYTSSKVLEVSKNQQLAMHLLAFS